MPIEQPEDVEAGDILVLVVTSPGEDSTSPGIDGDQSINWGGLGNGIGGPINPDRGSSFLEI